MPEIDGFEFAETVRAVNKNIPHTFMSARMICPQSKKGFQLGIDDYIGKPIRLDELLLGYGPFCAANIEMERKIMLVIWSWIKMA